MNELIEIKRHDVLVQAVCGRELYARLEIKARYADWIKLQIERADLIQGIDFVTIHNNMTSPPSIDYALSIDAAKNIAMLSQTAKGKEVRAYFIECEKQLMLQQPKLPTTYLEALKELVVATELTEAQAKKIEQLEMAEMIGDRVIHNQRADVRWLEDRLEKEIENKKLYGWSKQ